MARTCLQLSKGKLNRTTAMFYTMFFLSARFSDISVMHIKSKLLQKICLYYNAFKIYKHMRVCQLIVNERSTCSILYTRFLVFPLLLFLDNLILFIDIILITFGICCSMKTFLYVPVIFFESITYVTLRTLYHHALVKIFSIFLSVGSKINMLKIN